MNLIRYISNIKMNLIRYISNIKYQSTYKGAFFSRAHNYEYTKTN